MRDKRQFVVELPEDMATAVEKTIGSGAYASLSELIEESLRALLEQDAAAERWLITDVVESYDHHKANPLTAVPADQVMARIQSRVISRRTAVTEA